MSVVKVHLNQTVLNSNKFIISSESHFQSDKTF